MSEHFWRGFWDGLSLGFVRRRLFKPAVSHGYKEPCYDIERMEMALAGPRWTMPSGQTREQRRQYIADCAAGKIDPDPAPPIKE